MPIENPSDRNQALKVEALAAARRVIELAPDYADGHVYLALFTAPERPMEREALLRRALGLQALSCQPCAYSFLGDLLLQTGRTEEALELYRRGNRPSAGPIGALAAGDGLSFHRSARSRWRDAATT